MKSAGLPAHEAAAERIAGDDAGPTVAARIA